MAKRHSSLAVEQLESLIHVIRGQRVMLDADLAKLYGVTTAALNQAVQRNAERFPSDFAYQLSPQEFKEFDVTNCDIKTGSWRANKTSLGLHRTRRRHALQRSAVAGSDSGQHRDHAGLRADATAAGDAGRTGTAATQLAETVQLHDEQIKTIAEILRQMMEKPPPPKGRIGFQTPANP